MDGRQALGRRRPQHFPEPVQLLASQEPFVLLHLEAGYAPAGIASGGTPTPGIRQVEHLDQDVGGPIRHRGHVMQPVVETQDVLVFHVRDEAVTEGGHDMLAQHEPVVLHRRRLAVHLDVFALIAFGEVGDGGHGRRLRWDRRLALLDSGDDRSGVLAGRVGSEFGIPAEPYALRPPERPGLDDEDLLARGVDSDTEPGKIVIPEDGMACREHSELSGLGNMPFVRFS